MSQIGFYDSLARSVEKSTNPNNGVAPRENLTLLIATSFIVSPGVNQRESMVGGIWRHPQRLKPI
jgi:hypothetical protein